jgi:hypothetical protein
MRLLLVMAGCKPYDLGFDFTKVEERRSHVFLPPFFLFFYFFYPAKQGRNELYFSWWVRHRPREDSSYF